MAQALKVAIMRILSSFSTARAGLQLLGLLTSLVDIMPLGRLHMRPLQFHLLTLSWPGSRDPQVLVPMADHVRPHLWWTRDQHLLERVPFEIFRPSLAVTIHTLQSSWGAFCKGRTSAGVWSEEEARLHIIVLEPEAVMRALAALQDHVQGRSLVVFSDNSTRMAYINRQGGTHSPQLCLKVWSFLYWC